MLDYSINCPHCNAVIPAHTDHACEVLGECIMPQPQSEGPHVLSGMTDKTERPSVK